MMCFKDITFCNSDCRPKGFRGDEKCPSQLTDKVRADAKAWWGKDGAPIAEADFSDSCKGYIPKPNKEVLDEIR